MRSSQKNWRNIERRMHKLYKDAPIERLMERFEMLIGRYGVGLKAPKTKTHFSQEDVLLIAYPDNIQNGSEATLATLHKFCVRHLKKAFNTIHLLPFFPSSSDEGFSVINYRKIEPRLGAWKHIQAFSQDFKLMVDLVLNHCSRKSAWFNSFINGIEPYQRYFITEDPQTDLSKVTRPRTSSLLNKVSTRDGDAYVWCTFSPDQIDLNWKDPDVLFEFLDILFYYISQGARIVRLDAVGFLWKKPGSNCIHLPETHQLIKLLHDCLQIAAPHVLLVTETNVPHQENISYFGSSDEAHMVYNFALPPLLLHLFLKEDSSQFIEWLKALPTPPKGCTFLNFIASHDGIGLRPLEGILPPKEIEFILETTAQRGAQVSYKTTENAQKTPYELNTTLLSALTIPQEPSDISLKRYLCLHALFLALKGIPAIYLNSLMATPNLPQDPENPRATNRKKWQEKELETLLKKEHSPHARAFKQFQHLLQTRNQCKAFSPDADIKVYSTPSSLVVFQRTCMQTQETILCLFNVTNTPQSLESLTDMPSNIIQDIIAGDTLALEDTTAMLQPYQAVWGLVAVGAQYNQPVTP